MRLPGEHASGAGLTAATHECSAATHVPTIQPPSAPTAGPSPTLLSPVSTPTLLGATPPSFEPTPIPPGQFIPIVLLPLPSGGNTGGTGGDGGGSSGDDQAAAPTSTRTPTRTPTATPMPATATPAPATATPVPPSATPVPAPTNPPAPAVTAPATVAPTSPPVPTATEAIEDGGIVLGVEVARPDEPVPAAQSGPAQQVQPTRPAPVTTQPVTGEPETTAGQLAGLTLFAVGLLALGGGVWLRRRPRANASTR